MIEGKENEIFKSISDRLRSEFESIYIIGEELSSKPPSFPSVSIVQNKNVINTRYSIFGKMNVVSSSEFKVEIFSNDKESGYEICLKIGNILDEIFTEYEYLRTFNEPVKNSDNTIYRRVMRFTNSVLINN
ncbi:MAG: hypothetical protein HFF36_02575 [Coprobacillus sp.]|nr:hypothetical protein [Coprobacillus sp.]